MTDTAAEIIATHRLVWEYRNMLEAHWPTPGRIDALRFAFTEAGEAMDADLRSNPVYARNNDRNMSVPDELGDCAMMLCTALGDTFDFGDEKQQRLYLTPAPHTELDTVCFAVTLALFGDGEIKPLRYIESHLRDRYGISMAERVEARLRRIALKVLPA
jgi:hypothetical protein